MFTQFDQVQTQIEIATTSEMQTEIDIREEMENDFISLIATAQKIIDKMAERSDFASVKSEVRRTYPSPARSSSAASGCHSRVDMGRIGAHTCAYRIATVRYLSPGSWQHFCSFDGRSALSASNAHLTYEELASLFSYVESILNSRPLCPLSSSPNDFQPLTPGHFIIGRALTSLPSPHLADINPNRLDRFQRLEALRQHFWRRWQMEYVCELQQRTKWRVPGRALQLGDLVLIKEENTPPMHWRLGRIAKLFPGADGISRVAEVATGTGTYKRGVKYLCPLLDETHEALKADASKGPQDVAAPTNGGEVGNIHR
ncbi:uncharacterized protein LOC134754022 [Cydia strobilella]|uniref:uncharacterized protein LOC134754022 n=1 Tax=Cydia strobilella TaxID=1100964 RepID=UPI0030042E19